METNLANAEKSYNAEVNDLKEEVSKLQALQQQIQETHAQEIDSLRKNREEIEQELCNIKLYHEEKLNSLEKLLEAKEEELQKHHMSEKRLPKTSSRSRSTIKFNSSH